MTNAAVTKRTPVITWEKPVDGLQEFMQLINEMRKNRIINEFLNTHTLYNEEITHNACFDLEILENVAYVYLNGCNASN